MTHQEHLLLVEFLERQWNLPSRSDKYSMQVAAEVRRGRTDSRVDVEDLALTFEVKKKVDPAYHDEHVKDFVMGWIGASVGDY